MELITSGLESFPKRLTPRGIYALSFHEHEKIRDTLFTVQVVNFNDMSNNQIPVDVELPEETSTLAQVAALKSQQKNLLSTTINGGV